MVTHRSWFNSKKHGVGLYRGWRIELFSTQFRFQYILAGVGQDVRFSLQLKDQEQQRKTRSAQDAHTSHL